MIKSGASIHRYLPAFYIRKDLETASGYATYCQGVTKLYHEVLSFQPHIKQIT